MIYNKYIELKKDNDKLLYLFEVGNFFIFINEDAKKISELTNLKLTKFGNNIKCGFPINSLEKYNNLFNELGEVIDDLYHLPFADLMSKHNRKNKQVI